MSAVYVDESVPLRPVSVAEYFHLFETGFYGEDDRVELLSGVVVEMSPPTPEHDSAIAWVTMFLARAVLDAGLWFRVQSAVLLEAQSSVPQPDLLVVPPHKRSEHPTGGLLAVEVSVTSLAVDRRRKAGIYAAAGIPEYWVVDVRGRRVLRHLEPSPEGYGLVETLGEHNTLRSHLDALPPIAVRELLDGELG